MLSHANANIFILFICYFTCTNLMNWLFVGILYCPVLDNIEAGAAFLNLIPKHFVVLSNFAFGVDM